MCQTINIQLTTDFMRCKLGVEDKVEEGYIIGKENV